MYNGIIVPVDGYFLYAVKTRTESYTEIFPSGLYW